MKKGYQCPACGTMEAIRLAITTARGKSLSVLLASQSILRRPETLICCLECSHVAGADSFRVKRGWVDIPGRR